MQFNVGLWKPRLAAPAIVTSLLTACTTVNSEVVVGVCPPVVEYNRVEQALVATEIESLPEDTVLIEWLADYSLLREQTNICAT